MEERILPLTMDKYLKLHKYEANECILLDDGTPFFSEGAKVLERPYNSWEWIVYEHKGTIILREYWDMVPDWDGIRCDTYKVIRKEQ